MSTMSLYRSIDVHMSDRVDSGAAQMEDTKTNGSVAGSQYVIMRCLVSGLEAASF